MHESFDERDKLTPDEQARQKLFDEHLVQSTPERIRMAVLDAANSKAEKNSLGQQSHGFRERMLPRHHIWWSLAAAAVIVLMFLPHVLSPDNTTDVTGVPIKTAETIPLNKLNTLEELDAQVERLDSLISGLDMSSFELKRLKARSLDDLADNVKNMQQNLARSMS